MPNLIISYDLNGPHPSHKDVDAFLARTTTRRARILETVWWVKSSMTAVEFRDKIRTIISANDRLLVVEGARVAWHNLPLADEAFKMAWEAN